MENKISTISESIHMFVNNPFDPVLRTHKLSGKLKEL